MKTRRDELHEQVLRFHREHPEVWDLFVRFTFDRIRRGFRHYSADAIMHQVRWETDRPELDARETFKINNNYVSFYARAFATKHPQHAGFFRFRRQISEDKDIRCHEMEQGSLW